MYPFYYMAACTVFFGILDLIFSDKSKEGMALKNYFFFMIVLFLIFFSGSRGLGTGVDDYQYRTAFKAVAERENIFDLNQILDFLRYEPITTLIMYFVGFFTKSSSLFLLFYAGITVSINAFTYKKASPLILVSLAVYSVHLFINKDMNQIRFGLSSALFVLAVIYKSENRNTCSLIAIILSCMTHQTAYAGIVFYLSQFFKSRYLPIYITLVGMVVGLIGGTSILGFIIKYLPSSVKDYQGSVFDITIPVISIANLKNIAFIFIYCKVLLNDAELNKKWGLKYTLIFCFSVGASLRMMFSDFAIIGTRVGNLFIHIEPILIAMLLGTMKVNRLIKIGILIAVCGFYITYNTILNPQSVMGYNYNDLIGL